MNEKQLMLSGEIFRSLISILKMFDFNNNDIGRIFRSCAKYIESGISNDDLISEIAIYLDELKSSDPHQDFDGSSNSSDDTLTAYDIEQLFEQSETYKSLEKIAKRLMTCNRARVIDRYYMGDTEVDLKRANKNLSSYIKMLPLLIATKHELISLCNTHDVRFIENRDDWIENASDDDLDREEQHFFYDEYISNSSILRIDEDDLYETAKTLLAHNKQSSLIELKTAIMIIF